jgi:hypothetical protein
VVNPGSSVQIDLLKSTGEERTESLLGSLKAHLADFEDQQENTVVLDLVKGLQKTKIKLSATLQYIYSKVRAITTDAQVLYYEEMVTL